MDEAGAAIAAAQLLALHEDPVRHRQRLTHGRETFPGALHAFRFAQGRFSQGVIKELSAQERGRLREAAVFFIRQICLWEGATHYQVLGVSPEAPRQAIKGNYHALMALLHPDRQDADSEHWPPDAAPRINQAYAILFDDVLRREYDAGLGKFANAPREFSGAGVPPPVKVPTRGLDYGRGAAVRPRHLKGFLIGATALASLFFVIAWWAADLPAEYSTLQSATPVQLTWRWMQDALSPSRPPRFIVSSERSSTPTPASYEPEKDVDSAKRAETRSTLVPEWLTQMISAPESKPEPARIVEALPEPKAQAEAPKPKEALRSPSVVAQVKVEPSPPSATPADVANLELLVANLVSHYEMGELDRLLGLFDTGSIGVVEAMNLRQDFENFFRTTRLRQLQLRTISWDTATQATNARGEALLRAAYLDRPEHIERVVAIKMAITWRDGYPRIARLSLYPHE